MSELRFEELRGQPHIALALKNAVKEGRVGHAYLFSGPRGTGKTSTERILAKAPKDEFDRDQAQQEQEQLAGRIRRDIRRQP